MAAGLAIRARLGSLTRLAEMNEARHSTRY